MRIISSVALFIAGVITLSVTVGILFPNFEGIQDLSGFERMFLIVYGLAIRRVHQRNRKLGKGFLRTCQRVVNSAGVCALAVIVPVAFIASDKGQFQSTSASGDELAVIGMLELLWLGVLLVAAYFAVPSLPETLPNSDALPIEPIVVQQKLEEQVEVTK